MKANTKSYIRLLAVMGAAMVAVTSCDDLFEPAQENISDIDKMYTDADYAQGLLANAYILMPYSSTPSSDMATDDAVANTTSNDYYKMASGAWTSQSDPLSQWQNRYNAIQYINIVIDRCDDVAWSTDTDINTLFCKLFKGDCYGMRALQMFYLLRAHAGLVGGQMMGVPILTEYQDASADFNLPRNTFKECIDQIMSDISNALELLPDEYEDVSAGNVPAKYGNVSDAKYNRAFGSHQKGKICGNVLKALRAQVALFAASPAYAQYSGITMADAAQYAAEVINGVTLPANGLTWYANATEIDGLKDGYNSAETIWKDNPSASNSLESSNFPPSLYGSGLVNPTQNLVDAFPMANGYPITDSRSGYDASKPYTDRDPRLMTYILVDGDTYGVENRTIVTGTYGTNELDRNSGINYETGASTRTGYYLKKLLRSDVNLSSSSTTTQKHYTARIRYTEIFLDYAEAANEAAGPKTAVGGCDKSAYDVILAIRQRAGITDNTYLDECATSQAAMRELIRNERRLELCFEGHRFYDLRRWQVDLSKLNETTTGMEISQQNGALVYKRIDVDTRNYASYQYYGPIPYTEVLKYDNLEQNEGW